MFCVIEILARTIYQKIKLYENITGDCSYKDTNKQDAKQDYKSPYLKLTFEILRSMNFMLV